MKYILFDDSYWSNFFPLTLTRSTGDLRVGILKLRQRISAYFGLKETNIIVSSFLEKIYNERHKKWQVNILTAEDTIFINSRLKVDESIAKKIKKLALNSCLVHENTILAARLVPKAEKISSEDIPDLFKKLKKIEVEKKYTWEYLWEFIKENAEYIKRDFRDFFYEKDNFFETEPGVTVINPYNVWIGGKDDIMPGVIIDATNGPVVLDENVKIMANSVIIGPVYIGKNSTIKVGAKIYEGTSVGPVCKIGGEVEGTIFHAYTNKQHDGFLGHSYLGEWVNIGAGTNNSDLKNNYKNVAVYFYRKGSKIDSGSQFVGTFMGDHTKTGINSTINTGTVIGVGCNLFGRELITDYIPSFSWGDASNLSEYVKDKFLETAEIVKRRRKLKLTANEKELYRNIRKIVFE
jgi:UDP-N-acetylglucosamine diphosphorylase/glucosamine-1-phosphate N-acetyltransferase